MIVACHYNILLTLGELDMQAFHYDISRAS